ncbi:MAG: hypothetical protein H6Q84_337 [Deltaproteobacteria bacterium]|nr:hypothetical protein [Deltaproteobacteria bacterium]
MRRNDVPQDRCLFGEMKEIRYAVDEEGRYVLVESAGWEPVNIANREAWKSIDSEVEAVAAKVRAGELSPLAWHMARNQMDPGMLAGYVGLSRWRVRRHMKPAPFRRMRRTTLARYAAVFRVAPEEFLAVPGSRP